MQSPPGANLKPKSQPLHNSLPRLYRIAQSPFSKSQVAETQRHLMLFANGSTCLQAFIQLLSGRIIGSLEKVYPAPNGCVCDQSVGDRRSSGAKLQSRIVEVSGLGVLPMNHHLPPLRTDIVPVRFLSRCLSLYRAPDSLPVPAYFPQAVAGKPSETPS